MSSYNNTTTHHQHQQSSHHASPPPPPPKNMGGPHGLGDPNDLRLRKVETEIMVPMKMRDKAKEEKCPELVTAFHDCCVANGLLMVVQCRKENSAMKECLAKWYNDEAFKKECTDEYLRERSEYRRTGVKKKDTSKYTG